ncbi:MAG TPA: hypothetical protein VNC80_03120 [Mycobacteriales bacterium]|nr:hypothetical protein [Mycobacteriales bacterium]
MLRRAGLVLLAAALLAGISAGIAGPAYADPSVIGDGSIVGDGDYIGSANPDPGEVQATAGHAQDDACAPVAGAVTATDAADAQSRLVGQTPTGDGQWTYVLCVGSKDDADALARLYPDVQRAKAHCAAAANACVVVVVWSPADRTPPRRAQDPPSRLGAFDHWLDFTPELTTSPTYRDALIAQLPTWVWDRNTADVRGICLPIYGGVCGFAVRLGTKWKTEGSTFCHGRGREYHPGRDDPRSASDCSWTYHNSGTYGIQGCKNWLVVVWRLPWYIPIVFPLEVCHTDQVGVQEAQILSGQPPR